VGYYFRPANLVDRGRVSSAVGPPEELDSAPLSFSLSPSLSLVRRRVSLAMYHSPASRSRPVSRLCTAMPPANASNLQGGNIHRGLAHSDAGSSPSLRGRRSAAVESGWRPPMHCGCLARHRTSGPLTGSCCPSSRSASQPCMAPSCGQR